MRGKNLTVTQGDTVILKIGLTLKPNYHDKLYNICSDSWYTLYKVLQLRLPKRLSFNESAIIIICWRNWQKNRNAFFSTNLIYRWTHYLSPVSTSIGLGRNDFGHPISFVIVFNIGHKFSLRVPEKIYINYGNQPGIKLV